MYLIPHDEMSYWIKTVAHAVAETHLKWMIYW